MQTPKLCRTFLLLLITTASIVHSSSASPQDQQAQQTLEKALQALGGIERLRNLNSLFFKGKGSEFRTVDLQGPDPSTPTKTFHEETTAAFPSQERISYEQRTGRHDGSFRWRRWMYAGEERTVVDMQDDFISQVRRDPNAATERARIARTIPHLLSGLAAFPAKDPSRDRVMKFFGDWLIRNNLEPAQIYGFHDRGFATMKQVHEILNLKRNP